MKITTPARRPDGNGPGTWLDIIHAMNRVDDIGSCTNDHDVDGNYVETYDEFIVTHYKDVAGVVERVEIESQTDEAGHLLTLACTHCGVADDIGDVHTSTITEHDMETELLRRFVEAQENEEEIDEHGTVYVENVSTFADHGLLTNNSGIVVRLDNGDEFQISIVQSGEGRS